MSEVSKRKAMVESGDKPKKKLKYPKSVFFIISNEFCERFSYYGMRTILVLYLNKKLDYGDNTSTVIYHVFTMFVYFFPLIGAMIADSFLGKFATILYLSVVYAIGQLLLSASAVPTFGLPIREFSLLGLFLIAVGTGGIKPCVAAFGGDQFILPQQERYLAMFFSVFYFSINSGSLLSTFLTPELRHGVQCFGEQTCYPVAFFVPAVLMIVSIVLFVAGKSLYRMKKPEGNVVFNVTKCISHAIYNKVTLKERREHWLDHADDKYDKKMLGDVKAALQVLKLFIPLPFFWALFDQQSSRWTFQATRMDGEIGSFLLKADQMQVVNPLFIVILIPIFEKWIYPLLNRIKIINTPLKKMTTGGFLACLAFILSALVELELEKTYPVLPSQGVGQLRIFNPRNCSLQVEIYSQSFELKPFGMWENTTIHVKNSTEIEYTADFSKCELGVGSKKGFITAVEEEAMSYVLMPDSNYMFEDHINKTKDGNPVVRVLSYNTLLSNLTTVDLIEKSKVIHTFSIIKNETAAQNSTFADLNPSTYEVSVNGEVTGKIIMKLGGVYTIQAYVSKNLIKTDVTTVTPPNSIHILWLIPQYVVITIGEVLFSVTGLEFAFTQAPISMKSLLQAGWLITVAFGNLIVVIIAEAKIFKSQANEFFLFAALMFVDMLIFAVMAKFYKYVTFQDKESTHDNDIILQGRENLSFSMKNEN